MRADCFMAPCAGRRTLPRTRRTCIMLLPSAPRLYAPAASLQTAGTKINQRQDHAFWAKKTRRFPHIAGEPVDLAQKTALTIAKAINDLTSPILENSALGGCAGVLLTPKHSLLAPIFFFDRVCWRLRRQSSTTHTYNSDRKYNTL